MNQPMPLIIHCINEPYGNQEEIKQNIMIQKVKQSNYKVTELQSLTEFSYQFEFVIGLAGNCGGQSSILSYFKQKIFEPSQCMVTLVPNFEIINLKNDSDLIKLYIWDVKTNNSLGYPYFRFFRGMRNCVFLVYRIDQRATFQRLKDVNQAFNEDGGTNAIKVLVGNCSDLQDKRQVSETEAKQFLKAINGTFFIEVSAKTGHNIHYLFGKTVEILKEKFNQNPQTNFTADIKLKAQKKKRWWQIF